MTEQNDVTWLTSCNSTDRALKFHILSMSPIHVLTLKQLVLVHLKFFTQTVHFKMEIASKIHKPKLHPELKKYLDLPCSNFSKFLPTKEASLLIPVLTLWLIDSSSLGNHLFP